MEPESGELDVVAEVEVVDEEEEEEEGEGEGSGQASYGWLSQLLFHMRPRMAQATQLAVATFSVSLQRAARRVGQRAVVATVHAFCTRACTSVT